ncbi:DHHC family palmitoyltransferase [Aspergillus clavatus NRRL 1]|uniref:Palmitoyltransferase n=1 Tax=Aspergillus clavatus (strain ATCC 1007 / CBS 513.65 / DSM 816 / NCTC 3887 / NRRL 1 / QM 1276 / 107) TaxID=344612 RepID=A1C7X9_ASPCL|nr:DHHC zinc finger domain protein [Aspergillus clavatus NRRL 1]EAW14500.1 DHHC zinc finger domain protein [Aspergillus clavatus NRRL 1]
MATLASSPPASPSWPKRRPRAWALRCERYCCAAASYFPLAFVYSLTTWAVYVETSVGLKPSKSIWIGLPRTIVGVLLYIFLNVSYTVAVFTDPGSPLTTRTRGGRQQYSALPVAELPEFTAYTVNSTGGSRFCKKCQCLKPDRAHHCSTCKRCVLKMDHHCPWLATCVGLYNYKAFLLFLVYTSLFCWVDFAVASAWIWTEVLNDTGDLDSILPVNVVLLAILGGIIGLVLTGFTVWHISLALRGMTTIECLEKTRYVSPLRKALDRHRHEHSRGHHGESNGASPVSDSFGHRLQDYGQRVLDAHANAIPGVTRAEEGEERLSPAPGQPRYELQSADRLTPAQQALTRSYAEMERQREHDRYQDYLNEEDNEKLPHAFDLGWRKNLLHLFGPQPLLWLIPVCTTTGDGWYWEPSREFFEAQERRRLKREQDTADEQQYYRDLYQRNMDNSRSWLGPDSATPTWTPNQPLDSFRDPERPTTGVSMQTLAPMSPRPRPGDSDFEDAADEDAGLLNRGPETLPSRSVPVADRRRSDANGPAGRLRKPDETAPGAPNSREQSDEWRDWD